MPAYQPSSIGLLGKAFSTSPLENISKPKTPKYLPDPFSKNDIQALLEASDELPESTSQRAKAMILFLLDSGARLSELVNLKYPDIDLKTGRAKIVGKGAKERFIYFGRKTKKSLMAVYIINKT